MVKAGLTNVSASWDLRHFDRALFWGYTDVQTAETHVLGVAQVSHLCNRRQLRRHHWKLFPLKCHCFVSWFAKSVIVWHQIPGQNGHVIANIWLCVYIQTGHVVELWETLHVGSHVVTALKTLMILYLWRLHFVDALHSRPSNSYRWVYVFFTRRIQHILLQVFLQL